jgi:colanic acid/amylovoran biosynthesis glycosyltransferase
MSSVGRGARRESGDSESRPLRVLYVVSLFPCWSETFIVREVEALLRQDVDVRILSLRGPSERLVQPEAAALAPRVVYAPAGSVTVAGSPEMIRLMSALVRRLARHPVPLFKSLVAVWRAAAARPAVAALAPRIIHAHWATYPSTAALLLSRALGVSFSFTGHAHDLYLEDHLIRAKLRAAEFAVTVSDFNLKLLVARYGVRDTAKVRIVHCGIPLEKFPFELDKREPGLVVGVGRLDPIKGFDHLVEACRKLRAEGVALRCEIVGDGPEYGRLARQISQSGLELTVRLRGALKGDDVRRLLGRASVFALPSIVTRDGNMDGIPVALMEAMACGVPVVSTTVSGIPELVGDGQSGRLVPPGDSAALAGALRQLLEQPALRAALATAGREVVEKSFDIKKEAGKLGDLLRSAGQNKDGIQPT